MTETPEGTYQPAAHVVEALARCITDVRAVGKDSRNNEQKYNFRGVDAVVNAAHPVLAKHRVVIVPHAARPTYTPVTSKHGTAGRFVDLELTYRVYGPGGPQDFIDATVYGESADYGDKATAKAFSVAYRICLLQLLNLPTDDPDPDAGAAFEHVSQAAARNQAAAPEMPRELADAREAVRGAWAFHYGAFNQAEAAEAYAAFSGGKVMAEAGPSDLRKWAAYLANLPKADAGGSPADTPPPAGEPQTTSPDRPMSGRQRGMVFALLGDLNITERHRQLEYLISAIGRTIKSRGDLTEADAKLAIDALQKDLKEARATGLVPEAVSSE